MDKDRRLILGAFIIFVFLTFVTYFTLLIAVTLPSECAPGEVSVSSSQDVADTAVEVVESRK